MGFSANTIARRLECKAQLSWGRFAVSALVCELLLFSTVAGNAEAEEFEITSANQLRLIQQRLWLDGQLIWNHAGGQISTSDRLEHNLSFMVGGSFGGPIGKPSRCDRGCIDGLRLAGRFFYSIKSGRGIERETGTGWEASAALTPPLGQTIRGRVHTS